jgi:hypothetical protein
MVFFFSFYIPLSRFNILVGRCVIFKHYGQNVVYYVNWCLKIHTCLPMKFQCMNVFPQVPLSILSRRSVCYCLFVLVGIIDKRMATTLGISLDEYITYCWSLASCYGQILLLWPKSISTIKENESSIGMCIPKNLVNCNIAY